MTTDGIDKTVASLIKQAESAFIAAGIPTPRLDAEAIMALILNVGRAWLFAHPEQILETDKIAEFEKAIHRREKREPVAYIAGEKEFYSLPFHVTKDTLVPRPETELLVDEALRLFPAESKIDALDIGAGSGAIAVTIAKERPKWRLMAVDLSEAALAVARENAKRHGVAERVEFKISDVFSALGGAVFDLIAANPPYVPAGSEVSPEAVLFEPHSALFAGEAGLSVIEVIVSEAAAYLKNGGRLVMEIGYGQAADVAALIERSGNLKLVKIARDLAGIERVVTAAKKA